MIHGAAFSMEACRFLSVSVPTQLVCSLQTLRSEMAKKVEKAGEGTSRRRGMASSARGGLGVNPQDGLTRISPRLECALPASWGLEYPQVRALENRRIPSNADD